MSCLYQVSGRICFQFRLWKIRTLQWSSRTNKSSSESKDSSPDTTQVIGVREGNLYRLQGEPVRALVHNNDSLCELWHKRMGHLHHMALPILREIVIGLLEFRVEQHGVCRGCMLDKHARLLSQAASIGLRRF
jgi:hypothetical protein